MSIITISNLSKIYRVNNEPFYALNDISLDIDTSKKTIIIGKSGSGKSTLLHILNGLLPYESGTIHYPQNFTSSTVFQESRLLPWLTIEENCTFWNNNEDPTLLLQELELYEWRKLYPHEISGGMAQKTALIRALLYQSNFLMLDEPFASLDYFTRLNLQNKLLTLSEKYRLGMIFITHNVDKAISLGDYIVILEKGRIKEILNNDVPVQQKTEALYNTQLKNKIITMINK